MHYARKLESWQQEFDNMKQPDAFIHLQHPFVPIFQQTSCRQTRMASVMATINPLD